MSDRSPQKAARRMTGARRCAWVREGGCPATRWRLPRWRRRRCLDPDPAHGIGAAPAAGAAASACPPGLRARPLDSCGDCGTFAQRDARGEDADHDRYRGLSRRTGAAGAPTSPGASACPTNVGAMTSNEQPAASELSRGTVTKAVIPAAGMGTRFLPATKATPKEMLPVVDKPAIQYVVEEATRAGLHDVLMVTGRNKTALEDHFDRHWELERALEAKGDEVRLCLLYTSPSPRD